MFEGGSLSYSFEMCIITRVQNVPNLIPQWVNYHEVLCYYVSYGLLQYWIYQPEQYHLTVLYIVNVYVYIYDILICMHRVFVYIVCIYLKEQVISVISGYRSGPNLHHRRLQHRPAHSNHSRSSRISKQDTNLSESIRSPILKLLFPPAGWKPALSPTLLSDQTHLQMDRMHRCGWIHLPCEQPRAHYSVSS